MVESDRKKILYVNLHVVIYATYKDIVLIHSEQFFFFREGGAPIALMDKPPLVEYRTSNKRFSSQTKKHKAKRRIGPACIILQY